MKESYGSVLELHDFTARTIIISCKTEAQTRTNHTVKDSLQELTEQDVANQEGRKENR